MSEHADTIVALEAELAEARRERDNASFDAGAWESNFLAAEGRAHDEKHRAEAAEAENARLKAALEPFASRGMGLPMAWWGYVEAARAAFASGSEGDTA